MLVLASRETAEEQALPACRGDSLWVAEGRALATAAKAKAEIVAAFMVARDPGEKLRDCTGEVGCRVEIVPGDERADPALHISQQPPLGTPAMRRDFQMAMPPRCQFDTILHVPKFVKHNIFIWQLIAAASPLQQLIAIQLPFIWVEEFEPLTVGGPICCRPRNINKAEPANTLFNGVFDVFIISDGRAPASGK
jgi:hypothetical protein